MNSVIKSSDHTVMNEKSIWKQVLFLFRNIRKFYYGKGLPKTTRKEELGND